MMNRMMRPGGIANLRPPADGQAPMPPPGATPQGMPAQGPPMMGAPAGRVPNARMPGGGGAAMGGPMMGRGPSAMPVAAAGGAQGNMPMAPTGAGPGPGMPTAGGGGIPPALPFFARAGAMSGRAGDRHMVHVSDAQLPALRQMSGRRPDGSQDTVNPATGQREFADLPALQQTVTPYDGDMATYGQRGEHRWLTMAPPPPPPPTDFSAVDWDNVSDTDLQRYFGTPTHRTNLQNAKLDMRTWYDRHGRGEIRDGNYTNLNPAAFVNFPSQPPAQAASPSSGGPPPLGDMFQAFPYPDRHGAPPDAWAPDAGSGWFDNQGN